MFSRRASWDGTEHALTTVRFEDETVGQVDARLSSDPERQPATRFEIAGTEGLVEFDSEAADPVRIVGSPDATVECEPAGEQPVADPHRPALAHFVDCLATGQEPLVSVDDAVEAVQISLAAVESARSGTPVAPSEVTP